jgi:hypothetical protein
MQTRTLFAAVFALLALTAHASIMLGGAKDVEVDDHAKSVAAFAVQELNAKNAFGSGSHELVRVTGYKTQVRACVCVLSLAGEHLALSSSGSPARAGPRTHTHTRRRAVWASTARRPLTVRSHNHPHL